MQKYNQNRVIRILVSPPYMILNILKLSKYIEKKKEIIIHPIDVISAPGSPSFVLKFSLGRKRNIIIKTIIKIAKARIKRMTAKTRCWLARTGSKR